jgi:catechol 2,3-dioxygenase-like lactoylglutathione lyase family enzyme
MTSINSKFRIALLLIIGFFASSLSAQSPSKLYDHIHMSVPNPQESATWYLDNIGGDRVDGRDDRLLYSRTRVMWLSNRGNTRKPSQGSVVDHIGFSFTNLNAKVEQLVAAGATLQGEIRDIPGLFKLAFVVDPWGTRLELIEDDQHLGLHHIHLRDPNPAEALDWYENMFGGVRLNLKGRLPGLLYPGNVWLLVSEGDTFPSTEGTIDHIGWRAPVMEDTMAELVGRGAVVSVQPREMTLPNGVIEFFYIEGPHGANVELGQRQGDMP